MYDALILVLTIYGGIVALLTPVILIGLFRLVGESGVQAKAALAIAAFVICLMWPTSAISARFWRTVRVTFLLPWQKLVGDYEEDRKELRFRLFVHGLT